MKKIKEHWQTSNIRTSVENIKIKTKKVAITRNGITILKGHKAMFGMILFKNL